MKVLIQRVKQASVTINDTLYSSIDKGILTLVRIEKGDTIENLKKSVQKIVKLRIFADEKDFMNFRECLSLFKYKTILSSPLITINAKIIESYIRDKYLI